MELLILIIEKKYSKYFVDSEKFFMNQKYFVNPDILENINHE
jgi:hypothetical protein